MSVSYQELANFFGESIYTDADEEFEPEGEADEDGEWESEAAKLHRFDEWEGECPANRSDLAALILINHIAPRKVSDHGYGAPDIICHATHDWFSVDLEWKDLLNADMADLRNLARCGLLYNSEYDGFGFFA